MTGDEVNEAARQKAALVKISHEVRLPMNAIMGMAGLLLDTDLTDEQRQYVLAIRRGGEALLGSVNDILDWTDLDAGRVQPGAEPFDLRQAVEGALEVVAGRADEKGLDLAYLIDPVAPGRVVTDGTRLRQVLVKLLANAVEFTDAGEVVVSVAANGDELTFSVRDTGTGIPPRRLRELFEIAGRRDASAVAQATGTGLGLAITTRVVHLLGGRVWAESTPRQGSTFFFTVNAPAAAGASPVGDVGLVRVGAVRDDLAPAEDFPLRILVAEDNPVNQQLALALLGKLGYRADVVINGFEVLSALERQSYDVVLMDVMMPEMDGLEATRRIRQRWPEPERPRIVAMTASALPGDRERCLAAGMDDYISKPVQLAQLAGVLVRSAADQYGAPTVSEVDPDALRRIDVPAGDFEPAEIERLLATLDDDGPAVVGRLISTYLTGSTQLVAAVQEGLTTKQPDAVRAAAHALKSSSTGLGAIRLARLCRELEAAAQADDFTLAGAFAAELDAAYAGTRDTLERVADILQQSARSQAAPERLL